MTNVMTKPRSIAEAEAVMDSIREFYAAWETAEDEEDLLQQMREYPAGYAVRSGWSAIGEALDPSEYCLTISGGGPSVRITGSFDLSGDASTARLEHQDWGTPWSELPLVADDEQTLLWFAQQVGPFA